LVPEVETVLTYLTKTMKIKVESLNLVKKYC